MVGGDTLGVAFGRSKDESPGYEASTFVPLNPLGSVRCPQ